MQEYLKSDKRMIEHDKLVEPTTIRLFIAVQLPHQIKHELTRLQKQLTKCRVLTGTYPAPEAMHLTLKFLGDVPIGQVETIRSTLRSMNISVMTAQLTLLMVFGNPRFPKIIYVDIDCQQLVDVVAQIELALSDVCEPEQRAFKPHLTLVRVKHVLDSYKLLECLDTLHVNSLQFPVDHIVLMQSELKADGPVHTQIERFNFIA